MDLTNLPLATCRSEKYTEGLIDLIGHLKGVENMVEIGSYQGESTLIFLENLTTLKKIFAVDPWVNGYCEGDVCSEEYPMEIVEKNFDLRTKNFGNLVKIKKTSEQFSKEIEDLSLDFVYIDGDHRYESCLKDIELWLPKVKKGGFIGGHDYLERCFPGVVRAVSEKLGNPNFIFEDTSWLHIIL